MLKCGHAITFGIYLVRIQIVISPSKLANFLVKMPITFTRLLFYDDFIDYFNRTMADKRDSFNIGDLARVFFMGHL